MTDPSEVSSALLAVLGKSCWNVSAGGAAASSFSLAFGAKVPRSRSLENPEASEDYRLFSGEYTLLVWCSWRLDGPRNSLASSDLSPEVIAQRLRQFLKGIRVTSTDVRGPAFDVTLGFDDGLKLHIFCDRLSEEDLDADNWQLESPTGIVTVGPGFRVSTEPRK